MQEKQNAPIPCVGVELESKQKITSLTFKKNLMSKEKEVKPWIQIAMEKVKVITDDLEANDFNQMWSSVDDAPADTLAHRIIYQKQIQTDDETKETQFRTIHLNLIREEKTNCVIVELSEQLLLTKIQQP